MTCFIDVLRGGSVPTDEEVAKGNTQDHAQAQVGVVGHEEQHQTVADEDLQAMQHRLCQVK